MRSFLLASLLFCACQGPIAPPDIPQPSRASLTLGTSDENQAFLPYTDGQDVVLVEGAQGGFHVWMRYQFDGVAGDDAQLERRARRVDDGELVLRSTTDVTMEQQSSPMPMFMCPSPVGLSVIDRPILFELHFTDANGELADQAIKLVPHCPDENRDFCLRICTG